MYTILVTGSYGYIASNLLQIYNKNPDCKIITIGTNTKRSISFSTAFKHAEKKITLKTLEDLCKDNIPDVIVHCAGLGTVQDAQDITRAEKSMIDCSEAVNTFAANNGIKRLIFLSSAAVYGNSLDSKKKSLNPISNYGRLKVKTEELFLSLQNPIKEKIILRLFSVYGPNLKKQLMFDAFTKFNEDEHPTFRGNGKQIRDFINIQDVIKIINYYTFIDKLDNNIKIKDVGTGIGTTIDELISSISKEHFKYSRRKKDYKFDNLVNKTDPIRLVADSSIDPHLNMKFIKIHDGVIEYANNFYKSK